MPNVLERAHQPIRSVLADVWEFAASYPDISAEQRGLLAHVLTSSLASDRHLSPEITTPPDVVDAQEALTISGSVRSSIDDSRTAPG